MYRLLITTLIVIMGVSACFTLGGCCAAVNPDLHEFESKAGDTTDKPGEKPWDKTSDKPDPGTSILATFPLQEGVAAYDVKVGSKEPKRIASQFQKTGENAWVFRAAGLREIWYVIADGEVQVSRDVDFSENVKVDYEPPLRFLTASLSEAQPIAGESKMIVRNLQTGAIRDQGKCTYRVEWVGRKQVDAAAGKMLDVTHIRMTREIHLNLAKVSIRIDQLRNPELGLVRGYTVRETMALGLIGSTTIEDMQLAAPSPNDDSSKPAEGD